MKIFVNDKSKIVPIGCNVSMLMKILDIQDTTIALAINEDIIPQTNWEQTILKPLDRIIIITPTCGG